MINWNTIEDFGKIPDVELARKLGVSPQAVLQARKRRGITALNPSPRYDIDWSQVPLGKMTDQHIADILRCSETYVCIKRQRAGIPAFGMLYRTVENEAAYYEESIIDAWLHLNAVAHTFQFTIGPYRVDWLIHSENEVWEFLGMWNHRLYGRAYQKKFAVKKKYLNECGYKVREIYRSEIGKFKDGVDLTSIHKAANFRCRGCLRDNVRHQARGLCAMCLRRQYTGKPFGPPKITFLKLTDPFICEDCGSTIRYKRVHGKCSKCYNTDRRQNFNRDPSCIDFS